MERCLRKSWKAAIIVLFVHLSLPVKIRSIFGKTSDLAGIIRSSLEFNAKKYHKDSSLFVCRQCFQQLTKYGRAVKKICEKSNRNC